MQKKLRLKQSDAYDYLVATHFAVEAIIAYLEDDEHYQRIGNEQGDIEEWDDVVLHGEEDHKLHCQVKRQITDFCNLSLTREFKKAGKQKGTELQEKSALDDAFEKLGEYYEGITNKDYLSKKFRLVIPYTNIQIKKKLTVAQLKEVNLSCQKVGATVESFITEKGHSESVRTWLKSWCGFKSNEAIFNCLSHLEIRALGDEEDIRRGIVFNLRTWFENPDLVELKIKNFIVENASVAHSITPRLIVENIREYLKLDQKTWTRYSMEDAFNWKISGTLCGHQQDIEPPVEIINRLWMQSNRRKYELQFGHCFNEFSSQPLDISLLRLVLHVNNNVSISAKESSGWKVSTTKRVRYTLGTSNGDLSHINWIDKAKFSTPSEYREINTISNLEKESILLEMHMNSHMWNEIKTNVNNKIMQMQSGELRNAIEELWSKWKNEIDADQALQSNIAANMLSTKIENCLILGRLRAGPRTVELIGESLIMMLHLAIGLNAEELGWNNLIKDRSIKVVALSVWAGTQHNNNLNIRRFFDHDTDTQRSEFLGAETAKILVLPHSSMSDSIIYSRHLASGMNDGDGIADSRTPLTVINQYQDYLDAVTKNEISSLRDFFSDKVKKRNDSRAKHIQNLIKGN